MPTGSNEGMVRTMTHPSNAPARGALAAIAAAFLSYAVPVAAQSPAPGKKILFLAGPRDHGAPGRHEYERDLKTLAQSLVKKGIRVNGVAPGPIWTPLNPSGGQKPEDIPEFGKNTPDQVAAFLRSEQDKWGKAIRTMNIKMN